MLDLSCLILLIFACLHLSLLVFAQAVIRLKFICMEVQARIVPQALYGLEAFPNMDEAQYKMLKEMFRNAMAIAQGIPKTVCIPSKRGPIYKMYKCIAF